MAHNLFTYGSLMLEEVMRAVTGRIFDRADAVLDGYDRRALTAHPYPGLLPARGKRTAGVVWMNVDEETLALLDRFEDEFYDRRLVTVQPSAGAPVEAWAWIVRDSEHGRLSSRPWELEAFRAERLEDFLLECEGFRRTAHDGRTRRTPKAG